MEIGILTFHWGTNYGGILQAYALQKYLSGLGHSVEIINYKPRDYDFSWIRVAKHPSLLKDIPRILSRKKKEQLLSLFRNRYLKTTPRYGSVNDFGNELDKYDVLISGSDQILNPSFTCAGDNGKPSPVYWLGIAGKRVRKLGYAVSFGCEVFPSKANIYAEKWVNNFDAIGARENTGLLILNQLGYSGEACLTPDPTILFGRALFTSLGIEKEIYQGDYTCIYMLRHEVKIKGNVRYIDETHHPLTMEEWLLSIVCAKQLITNSYHGMIMALLAHVPFVVLLESGQEKGMNDRFFTLLSLLNSEKRCVYSINDAFEILKSPIDFESIDNEIKAYRNRGIEFFNNFL